MCYPEFAPKANSLCPICEETPGVFRPLPIPLALKVCQILQHSILEPSNVHPKGAPTIKAPGSSPAQPSKWR